MFAARRTNDTKGVTIPSQICYARYYEHVLRHGYQGQQAPAFRITSIYVETIPSFSLGFEGGCAPYFKVQAWKEQADTRQLVTLYNSWDQQSLRHLRTKERGTSLCCASASGELRVTGDIKVVLCHSGLGGHCTDMCSMWFNTKFVKPHETLVFCKGGIDGACKDTKCVRFPADFKVHISLQSAEQSERFFALTLLQKRKFDGDHSTKDGEDVISV